MKDAKKEAAKKWNSNPCGANYSTHTPYTKEYFDEIESHRYRTHPFIRHALESFAIAGKKVLEVGFGMGTDHITLARRGAQMHGIDLTPQHHEITKRRLELYNHKSELTLGDAEKMPYKNASFDFIYSLGVIHHTTHPQDALREIYRVLKDGAQCWIALYHRHSFFYWWSTFLWNYLIRGRFLRESFKEHLSRIEYPGDNPNLTVLVYTKGQLQRIFKELGFRSVTVRVDHLSKDDISIFGRILPQKLLNFLAPYFGWYVIVEATK